MNLHKRGNEGVGLNILQYSEIKHFNITEFGKVRKLLAEIDNILLVWRGKYTFCESRRKHLVYSRNSGNDVFALRKIIEQINFFHLI